MDRYYDTERPLPADDFEHLAKVLLVNTKQEKEALGRVLSEFFVTENGHYHNERCDKEIAKFHTLIETASKAGKASAAKRLNKRSTRVQRSNNIGSTNQNQNQNQNQVNPLAPSASAPDAPAAGKKPGNGADPTPVVENIPLNDGTEYAVHQSFVAEMDRLYPSVDVPATLREMRAWCLTNPANRKTARGVAAFMNRWLAKEQNKHG